MFTNNTYKFLAVYRFKRYNYQKIKEKKKGGEPTQDTYIFQRVEKKYRITNEQKLLLISQIGATLTPDEHGKSTICSLYLDTPDFRIIRASLEAKEEKAAYKEKLRVRSYGVPSDDSKVFLETKKKYKGIVYKRRVAMSLSDAREYIYHGEKPFDNQIMRELDYAMRFYSHPSPSMLLCYEREAFYCKSIPSLRLTFDTNIRYRVSELSLSLGSEGKIIIPDDECLLEIKTDGGMPLYLSAALEKAGIYPTSFSKYGTAYTTHFCDEKYNKIKGDNKYDRAFLLNNRR